MNNVLTTRVRFTLAGLALLFFAGCAVQQESVPILKSAKSQTIVVFGASGKIGGLIVAEALGRGHKVIGVSRNPAKLSFEHDAFVAAKGDVTDERSFRDVAANADAVIISVQGSQDGNAPEDTVHARAAVTASAVFAGEVDAPYVLQIGGATTIHETKELMLQNLPFKAKEGSARYAMLFGHLAALRTYRASDIDWTVLTPPYVIEGWSFWRVANSTRTAQYTTFSEDGAPNQPDGSSASILIADLAVAAIDEVEKQQ